MKGFQTDFYRVNRNPPGHKSGDIYRSVDGSAEVPLMVH